MARRAVSCTASSLEKAERRLERKREKAEKRGVLTISQATGDGRRVDEGGTVGRR